MAMDKDQNSSQADRRENGQPQDIEKDGCEVVSLKEFSVRRRNQTLASKTSTDSEDDPDPGPSAA